MVDAVERAERDEQARRDPAPARPARRLAVSRMYAGLFSWLICERATLIIRGGSPIPPPDESRVLVRANNFLRHPDRGATSPPTRAGRRFAGRPSDAAHHAAGPLDEARIRTRFPQGNGYLHIGHAKSICLNFGLARDYGGACHLRFDDTNPEKESWSTSIAIAGHGAVAGLGWRGATTGYQASSYFDFMYRAAEAWSKPATPTWTSRRRTRCAPTAATLAPRHQQPLA